MRLFSLLGNLRRFRTVSEDFLLDAETIPRHVAVIMDGNGRWAARRRLPTAAGHREGAKALKRTIAAARKASVKELTIYAFSTENWRRPTDEIEAIMSMFSELIASEVPELKEKGVRVRFIGRRRELSGKVVEDLEWTEEFTADNREMTLFVAFNYGSRAEIADAACAAAANGSEVDEDSLGKYLYAPDMHDPELLIRTSGEQRISNFLLWQCAYAELFFSNKLWPDFGEEDFNEALAEYSRRRRRFGGR
ncbi:MAG: polyprenyl diphosphate synthase [Actinomycetota bacterium]